MPGLGPISERTGSAQAAHANGVASEVQPSQEGIGTKGREDHQEMMVINRKRASRQSRVGLPENRSRIPLRSLRSYVRFGFWVKSKRLSTRRCEPRNYATANVFMQHPKKARLSWITRTRSRTRSRVQITRIQEVQSSCSVPVEQYVG